MKIGGIQCKFCSIQPRVWGNEIIKQGKNKYIFIIFIKTPQQYCFVIFMCMGFNMKTSDNRPTIITMRTGCCSPSPQTNTHSQIGFSSTNLIMM